MCFQVLVNDSLLLIEVSCKLVLDIDLIVLVLDLSQLFRCYSDLVKHLIKVFLCNNNLVIFLSIL
jgi:hypothetical protein